MSLPPRGGPWELLVGVPDANRDRGRGGGVQVCVFFLQGRLQDVNTWLQQGGDSSIFSGRAQCGILQFFRAAISLDQSPLATPAGVGSGGWAMLQRCQDTGTGALRWGGGCDTGGVHKRLGLTVNVTLPLLISMFLCFTYTYEKMVRSGVCGCWFFAWGRTPSERRGIE